MDRFYLELGWDVGRELSDIYLCMKTEVYEIQINFWTLSCSYAVSFTMLDFQTIPLIRCVIYNRHIKLNTSSDIRMLLDQRETDY